MITISAGLVILYDNKMLLAHPTGQKWYGTYSIPKGHVEEGEDHLETAIRETREEVGIEFDIDEIEPIDEEYIEYKDGNGEIYKKVHYFVIALDKPVEVDRKKLQKEEIDWAGFLTKEETEKRIFWRFKPLLKYLDKPMKKLVKENLNEGRTLSPARKMEKMLQGMIKEGKVTQEEMDQLMGYASQWANDQFHYGARNGYER
jgi:8-oxo-dGTP pyrophosphatase MutT (NUDIX family)